MRRPLGWLRVRLGIISAVAVALVLVGCGGDGDGDSADSGPRVVTSLEIFADMVRNVGGDRVDVDALLPLGADPHTFELAPDRVADVAQADVIFVNGLELEKSIEDVIGSNAGGPVIELAEGLPVIEGEGHDEEGEEHEEGENEEGHEHAAGNPHLWLDVRHAARYVERIRDELIAIDPEGRATYEANASAYLERLGDLDREFDAAVQSIPPERRKLVTFHDAYPYLAERYGLEVVAVVVPSPGQEPSARAVADLVRTLESEAVPAVFTEPQFNAEILEQAAAEAGVRVLDLLSDSYTDGVDSYVELMEYNVRQLQEGLGGE